MAKTKINSRQKGARAERQLAKRLRRSGYRGAKRGQQRSGLEQADVIGGPPGWWIECKHRKRIDITAAFVQAAADALPRHVHPAVVHRTNFTPWLVTITLDMWLALVGSPPLELPSTAADLLE